ncbi:uncharacterized protein J3D65DRAFT_14130 [Phyllosticta citribraziliensis]|uniref:DUF952 domain-containing protein n=1 Tax=Phyllosticta citribraziliensis TaxID=989973 RepID=A0ABR1M8W0_9PEZI
MATSHKSAFKILTGPQWTAWEQSTSFNGASIDLTDGYIHLSTAVQAGETYAKFFAGQSDLVVAEVDLEKLGDTVKWEPSRNSELFPHVYGSIPLTAVLRHWENVDGALFQELGAQA